MGMVITVDGEMCINSIGENTYDAFKAAVESIKNGYGKQAFTMCDDCIYFCND